MTYEKGLFAQADPGIVSGSTIERNKMSTKTIYKRIALVAVTALGMGVLTSVSPANAAMTSFTISNKSASSGVVKCAESATAVTGSTTFTAGGGTCLTTALTPAGTGIWAPGDTGFFGTISAIATANTVATMSAATPAQTVVPLAFYTGTVASTTVASGIVANTITGMTTSVGAKGLLNLTLDGSITGTAGKARMTIGGTVIGASDVTGVATDTNLMIPFTAPVTAGTYTASVQVSVAGTYTGTGADTFTQAFTLTVTAASTYSAALSTMHSVTGNGTAAATAADNLVPLLAPSTVAATNRGAITVTLRNAANATMASGNTITAIMTGSGGFGSTEIDAATPGASACATPVRVKTKAAVAVNTLVLCSDGTSGVGTATISVTNAAGATTVLGTKTITFYGTVATLSATVLQGIATPGTANGNNTTNAATQATLALTPAVVVVAKDANGVIVPALTVVGTPADLTIVASSTTAGAVDGTTDKNGPGYYNFAVTGGAAANVGKSTTIVYSTVVSSTLTISSAPVTISLGGTPATVTWALDKTSYAPGEKVTITVTAKDAGGNAVGDNTYATLFAGATVLGGQVTGSTPAASVDLVGGKATYTAFAPGSSGSYVISNKLGASVPAALQGTSLTGTIVVGASADMQAVTTLINSLIAKINALNKLVIKIQKKVKA